MRKLAIGAFSFSAAIAVCNYIIKPAFVLYAALLFALLGAALLGIKLRSLRALVIAAFCASLGFCAFALHYDLTTNRAHQLSGQTLELRFRLTGFPEAYPGYSRVEAQLFTDGYPRLNTILYDSAGGLESFSAGDLVAGTVRVSAADLRYGEHTDRYQAKDIYLTGKIRSELRLVGVKHSFSTLTAAAAQGICRRIERVFPADTAGFMKALMTGSKQELYEDDALYVSLSRAGLMHIVAVSGMHVSYLVGFLRLLLGKGRRSAIICILLVWCFVFMSGLSPSALRAAFMQTMLLLAPLFGREDDPITTLSAALAFLLLLNPYAAANISLQLSFSAMLGIVLFSERLNTAMLKLLGEGKAAALLRRPISSIACSLSVLPFSLPLTALYFGYVTLLTPISNLLCLFVVPYCFVGGFLVCLLGSVPWVGKAASFAVSLLVRYLFFVSREVAKLSWATVYLPPKWIILWCGFVCLFTAVMFLLFRRAKGKAAIILISALISLLAVQAGLRAYYRSADGTVTAIDVGQGQCISVISGRSAVLVDCGSTSYADYNAGDSAAAYLRSCGIKQLDALILTHFHADHANGIERLANLMPIGKLILPLGIQDSGQELLELLRCASQHQIPIEWVREDQLRVFEKIRVFLLSPETKGDENERCMPVILSVGDFDVISTGDAPSAREKALAEKADLTEIEALIVGHHGSKASSCEEYLSEIGGRIAVISVGKNSYGLPAAETLERLDSFGYTVYRTDLDGNVELRIDG